jgi:site-specific recombinase XerD
MDGVAAGPVQRRVRQQPVPCPTAVLQVAGRGGATPGPDDPAASAEGHRQACAGFSSGELSRLEKACQGRTFAQRRDAAVIAVFKATGIRVSELAGIRYDAEDPRRSDVDLWNREIAIRGKGGKARIVRIGYDAARSLDRYLRVRARHAQAWRPQLWLGVNNRGPLTANGIYQMIARRGRQCGVDVFPHRFRHHFSHTWLDRGGAEGDLMELNGWTSPQMLRRYGASARSARARRTYDRIMADS